MDVSQYLEIFIDESKGPLSIMIHGHVDIDLDGRCELECRDEFNIITRKNIIALDSVNSNIYLNSGKCKKLRESNYTIDITQKDKYLPLKQISNTDKKQIEIDKLRHTVNNLNSRLMQLEQIIGEKNGNK